MLYEMRAFNLRFGWIASTRFISDVRAEAAAMRYAEALYAVPRLRNIYFPKRPKWPYTLRVAVREYKDDRAFELWGLPGSGWQIVDVPFEVCCPAVPEARAVTAEEYEEVARMAAQRSNPRERKDGV